MAQVGIAIGLPFSEKLVHPRWAVALKTIDFPVNIQQNIILVENQPYAEARNIIVKDAQKKGCRYLWFIDDDVLIPRHAVQALGYVLDQSVEDGTMVSTGIYCTKTYAPAPVIYRDDVPGAFWDWRVNDVFDVDAAGCGCMLINMKVFDSLEEPYFATTEKYEDQGDGSVLTSVSEDIYFCRKVRAAGFKIKAHGAVICPHFNDKDGKFYELPLDSIPYKRERARQEAEKSQAEAQPAAV